MILSQEFLNCMKDMNETQIWKFMKILIALHGWEEIEIDSEFTFIVGQVKRYRNWLKEKEEERSQIYRKNAFARRDKTKSEQPKKKWWRKKTSEEKKAIHDWNTEIIEKVKEKVESYWLIYKAWKDEWIAASNIRIAKAFKKDSEKFCALLVLFLQIVYTDCNYENHAGGGENADIMRRQFKNRNGGGKHA